MYHSFLLLSWMKASLHGDPVQDDPVKKLLQYHVVSQFILTSAVRL
jgi:hypothetical protein